MKSEYKRRIERLEKSNNPKGNMTVVFRDDDTGGYYQMRHGVRTEYTGPLEGPDIIVVVFDGALADV